MPKFFVKSQDIINNSEIIIRNEDYNHIKNVLRKNINDELCVCNSDDSKNYLCKITEVLDKEIVLEIKEELIANSESNLNITIYQGLPKAEKMELIIQKSTELGVNKIVPTIMKRSVVKINEKDRIKKLERWQKIAEVAAKQSGRDKITKIERFMDIKDIKNNIDEFDTVLLAYEDERENSIKKQIQELKKLDKQNYAIAVIIGPEGGLDIKEVELLKEAGAKVITLGNRILRTETVALTMSSILMYELGDLN